MTESLPVMMSRAGQRLIEAKSSAEVLEAKKLAEAALHYAKVTRAANDTHADCLRIIARAEIRMANEIDKGQANGEVAPNGWKSDVRAADITTYADLGISRQRVSEWRELRDAGEARVNEAIDGALSEGRSPTKADIKNHVRGTFGTGENDWYTPPQYLDAVRALFGQIDLDPASSPIAQKTVKADMFFTQENDGLSRKWHGRVWLNPPYAQPLIAQFASKMVEEYSAGRVTEAVMLTHNYTDTAWFHESATTAAAFCFTKGRIRFLSADGVPASPTQGQAFHYFGKRLDDFAACFKDVGIVLFK